jgi:calcium-dependent protein kinase
MNNLRNFRADLKMQQAVLTLMVHQLITAEEMENQILMFAKLDTNKDGLLQKEEIIAGFKEIIGEQVQDEEVDEIMAQADLNCNGEIDYSEWLVATLDRTLINEFKLKMAFQYFNKSGNGKISLDELKEVMANNGVKQNEDLEEEVYQDILDEADEKHDGVIDFEEFSNMMKKVYSHDVSKVSAHVVNPKGGQLRAHSNS